MVDQSGVDALQLESNATLHVVRTIVISIDISVASISSS